MAHTVAYDPQRAAWVVLDFLGRKVAHAATEHGARTLMKQHRTV